MDDKVRGRPLTADDEVIPEPGEPGMIFRVDEFGPLNLQPYPGQQWAGVAGKEPARTLGRERCLMRH